MGISYPWRWERISLKRSGDRQKYVGVRFRSEKGSRRAKKLGESFRIVSRETLKIVPLTFMNLFRYLKMSEGRSEGIEE